MRRIADTRLIKITNLDLDLAVLIGKWADIANMAVAANQDWRSNGMLSPEVFSSHW